MTQCVYRGQGTICHPSETQGISQGYCRPHHLAPPFHHLFGMASAAPNAKWYLAAGPSQRRPDLRRGLLALCLAALCSTAHAFPGEQWHKAGQAHGVDPVLLYAVALAESATPSGTNQVTPWPYALRAGDEAHYPQDAQSASALLTTLMEAESARTLDVGLMQINLHWHGHRVDNPADLLVSRINLNIGAQILAEAMASSPQDPALGIGRYHSWRDDRARWYGNRVLAIYGSLLHSWSDEDDTERKGLL